MAKRRDPPPAEALTSNPFAALASLRDQLPQAEPPPPPPPASETATPPPRGPARAVVRYQRKGRGGKEATIVEQLGLSPELLDVWCREFKRALGCGGGVEGEHLVFGGDQRPRLAGLLEAKGVRRITVA
jgi:translation initiation factor 1